jgi:ubiquinone/menaquinone biosynthesis C-methylase UbiE
VTETLDPEGAHLAALRRLADFRGSRVLEMGCGEGRLTEGLAEEASHVLAFDPDADAVKQGRNALAAKLGDKVSFRVASAEQLQIAPGSFDLVVFSWSL